MSAHKVTVALPANFNPERHQDALKKKITEVYGPGYEIVSINMEKREAHVMNRASMTQIETEKDDRVFAVKLGHNFGKPSDGGRAAALLEDQHPGYYLAKFDPFLGQALMMKLTDEEVRARGAVANALGVKPWEVMLQARRGGGFDIKLPSSYVPAKHDERLQQVASVEVGREGWFVETDPMKLVARIIPSEPPTFPKSIGYPFDEPIPAFSLKKKEWARIPLGMKLPAPGQKKGEEFTIDLLNAAHSQVSGVSGGGKALSEDTMVMTPQGPRKNSELAVGDEVFSSSGQPTKLLALTPWMTGPLFRVHLLHAPDIDVSRDHLWLVSTNESRAAHKHAVRGDGSRDREHAHRLRALLATVKPGQAISVESLSRVATPELVRLLPSALNHEGWFPLGESLDFLARYLEESAGAVGLPPLETVVTTEEIMRSPERGWAIRTGGAVRYPAGLPVENPYARGRAGELTQELLRASLEERQELLRGLLHGSERILAVREEQTDAAMELLRSLGYWAVEVAPGFIDYGSGWVPVTGVSSIGDGRFRCLKVADPHQMFLVEGFTPTHNSVLLNDFIAGVLVRGAELVIVDLPSKSVDFLWCKQFVRPGGWGCKDLASAVTALALVMEEGERRAEILAQHKVTKWTELPDSYSSEFVPIVVVVDELTGLFYPEEEPKQLPKDHPLRREAQEINLQKAMLKKHIKRIAAELRFVGVSLTLSSQVASANTGIDPSLRTNLHNKILLGAKPTEGNRRLVLSDPERVPKVPENVQADDAASKGTGSAEPEGQEPCVFKTYYADVAELERWLISQGVKRTSSPEPTAAQITRHTPSLEDDAPAPAPRARKTPPSFATCDACALPINPVTGQCGCSH